MLSFLSGVQKGRQGAWVRGILCTGLLMSFLFLFVSCSFFLGGSRPVAGERPTGQHSNFIVDEVKGEVQATRINGLPEEIKISYTACFREALQTENPLPESVFKIHLFEFLNPPAGPAGLQKKTKPGGGKNKKKHKMFGKILLCFFGSGRAFLSAASNRCKWLLKMVGILSL